MNRSIDVGNSDSPQRTFGERVKNFIRSFFENPVPALTPAQSEEYQSEIEFLQTLASDFDRNLLAEQTPDAFLPISDFPWTEDIEDMADEIALEAQILLRTLDDVPPFGELQELQKPLSGNGWRVFPLLVYGHKVEWALRRFPTLEAAIDRIPGCTTAMFSILQPGQQLYPHVGPNSAVLRYHLGVHIPHPADCAIRVADETRHWEFGKSLILNDYREHEAWNNSPEPRVVLFVDFKRPVSERLISQRDFVIEEFARFKFSHEIVDNFEEWIEQHGETLDQALRYNEEMSA